MALADRVAEAWMSAASFAETKAENNAPYPTLVERWTNKSVAYENQAILVMEMVKADEKVGPRAT